jgi:signal transduction histidine kinase/CheY-like chemotaxis protein
VKQTLAESVAVLGGRLPPASRGDETLPEEILDQDERIAQLTKQLQGLRTRLEKLGGEVVRADYKVLHLTQEVRRAREAFNFLTGFQNSIGRASSLEELFESAMKAIVSELWMKRAVLLERSGKSNAFVPVSFLGYQPDAQPLRFTLPSDARTDWSKPHLVNGTTPREEWIGEVRSALEVPYFVWVPSQQHGRVETVLVAGNLVEDAAQQPVLSEHDLALIVSVGAILSVGRMNLLARERLKRQVRYQSLLHKVSALLMRHFDAPSTHFDEVLSQLGVEWSLDRVRLLFRHPDGRRIDVAYQWSAGSCKADESMEYPLDEIPRWRDAMANGETIIIDDVESLAEADRGPLITMGIRSLLLVPITVQQAVVAWASFEQYANPRTWTSADVQLLELFAGLVSRAIAREREVEERAQLEAEYHHSKKMEAVGQLAGGVAHDFNNLLTTIQGYAQLLSAKLPEEYREMPGLKEIVMASERAAGLTRQLLAFSRRDTGKTGPVEVNTVISDTMKLMRRMLGDKVTLDLDLADNLTAIVGDSQQLSQMVMNLAINARDAMPEGGNLTISTRHLAAIGALPRRFSIPGIEWCQLIQVTDTGVGMDHETKERIFEPFFTTKDAGQGTGLGLSIVFSVVRRHAGLIDVVSEPGVGTTFSIFLPVREPVAEEKEETAVHVTHKARPQEKILIVEDDDSVRGMICEVLESQGYEVLAVTNGREALDELEQSASDVSLIMTDVVMPDMGGLEMWECLVADGNDTPVVVMSGFPQGKETNEMLKSAAAYLQKPFGPNEISRTVRETLDSVTGEGEETTARGVH